METSAEDLQDGSETHCDFLCGDGGTERKTGGQGGGVFRFSLGVSRRRRLEMI